MLISTINKNKGGEALSYSSLYYSNKLHWQGTYHQSHICWHQANNWFYKLLFKEIGCKLKFIKTTMIHKKKRKVKKGDKGIQFVTYTRVTKVVADYMPEYESWSSAYMQVNVASQKPTRCEALWVISNRVSLTWKSFHSACKLCEGLQIEEVTLRSKTISESLLWTLYISDSGVWSLSVRKRPLCILMDTTWEDDSDGCLHPTAFFSFGVRGWLWLFVLSGDINQ